ncbi:MAG: hypothetical protein ACE5FH_12640 [Candidatus Zixiibacteriota bacterium]
MRKLALTLDISILLVAFLSELLGFGLITRARTHQMYYIIEVTGVSWLFVSTYVMLFFVYPIVNGIALITKDRGFLIEQVSR